MAEGNCSDGGSRASGYIKRVLLKTILKTTRRVRTGAATGYVGAENIVDPIYGWREICIICPFPRCQTLARSAGNAQ